MTISGGVGMAEIYLLGSPNKVLADVVLKFDTQHHWMVRNAL
jgi:hypothetical protein